MMFAHLDDKPFVPTDEFRQRAIRQGRARKRTLRRRSIGALGSMSVVAALLVAGLARHHDNSIAATTPEPSTASTPSSGASNSDPQTSAAAVTVAVAPSLSSAPANTSVSSAAQPTTTLSRPLTEGDYGEQVRRLQQRLKNIGFEPGAVNGTFTHLTTQAVWAFQTLVARTATADVDGVVTDTLWALMQQPLSVRPRIAATTSVHVEVLIPEQVLVVYDNQTPTLITRISSGTGFHWKATVTVDPNTPDNPTNSPREEDVAGVATTPSGAYSATQRSTNGWQQGALGAMYKPTYFVDGVAIHGALNVDYPNTHGSIRLPMGEVDSANLPIAPNPADDFVNLVPLTSQIFISTLDNPNATGTQRAPYTTN